mmetsp:Transcript_22241/g.45825  ORF Transcript_22241/g.45825 Transcript_22241/m.45825 type:complete len:185 (+) Transcript_22241:138-692(+)
MPFSWFGGHNKSSTAATADARANKSSHLSLSSSAKQRARLDEVRAKTKASYIAQSGDKLSLSRSRGSSGHSRHTSGSMDTSHQSPQRFYPGGQQKIVAIELDNDDSKHRRIDQGLLDACKEAQMQQKENENKSWWPATFSSSPNNNILTSASTTPPAPKSDSSTPISPNLSKTAISYTKTYRVP